MKRSVVRLTWIYTLLAVVVCLLLFLFFVVRANGLAATLSGKTKQQPTAFLLPPYYGTRRVTSVFDHEFPLYSNEPITASTTVMHNDGITRTENTSSDDARQSYSGHNGIDYDMHYERVLASNLTARKVRA